MNNSWDTLTFWGTYAVLPLYYSIVCKLEKPVCYANFPEQFSTSCTYGFLQLDLVDFNAAHSMSELLIVHKLISIFHILTLQQLYIDGGI